jgi:hypothetical protein
VRALARAIAAAAAVSCVVSGQAPHETFTARASVTKGAASASAPFTLTITRYATPDERDALLSAVRTGGSTAARAVLAKFGDAGVVQLGTRRTTVKYAAERPTASGRLLTVVTAEPIVYLGAGLPEAKARAGFDVAILLLDLHEGGGLGELAPAAKLGIDDGGALHIEDYGESVVWLNGLATAAR